MESNLREELIIIFDDKVENRKLNISFCQDCKRYHSEDRDCVMRLINIQEWIEL